MKISIGIAVIILVLGAVLGWNNHQRLAIVSSDHRKTISKANAAGISVRGETTKRQRVVASVDDINRGLLALAYKIQSGPDMNAVDDLMSELATLEMIEKVADLDITDISNILKNIQSDPALSDSTRSGLGVAIVWQVGEDRPAKAMALMAEFPQFYESIVASTLLGRWGETDLPAALQWIRKNSAAFPGLSEELVKQAAIAGLAESDPAGAFRLLKEMNMKVMDEIDSILANAISPEQRTAALMALRQHLAAASPEERAAAIQESLESMGRNLEEENLDAVRDWISSAKLNPEEIAYFADGISYFNTQKDTGRWIEWMATTLPPDKLAENVDGLIGQWTQHDYLAAGTWLSNAKAGPAKDAAVSTYAVTVAEYEPQIAEQWAMTLPPGGERQKTLADIYQNWPKNDKAAAKEFAKRNGINISVKEE